MKLRPWRYKDELEVIVVGDGVNHHRTWFSSTLTGPVTLNEKEYTLDPARIILEDPGFFGRRRDWFRRIRNHFKLVYLEGQPEPIGTEEPPLRSAELLFKIHRSRSLKLAFKTMFAKPFASRWLILLIVGVIVAVVAGMIVTGYLEIPGVNV